MLSMQENNTVPASKSIRYAGSGAVMFLGATCAAILQASSYTCGRRHCLAVAQVEERSCSLHSSPP
jgi:hypothetical protein